MFLMVAARKKARKLHTLQTLNFTVEEIFVIVGFLLYLFRHHNGMSQPKKMTARRGIPVI
jgi:hypothetical protein